MGFLFLFMQCFDFRLLLSEERCGNEAYTYIPIDSSTMNYGYFSLEGADQRAYRVHACSGCLECGTT